MQFTHFVHFADSRIDIVNFCPTITMVHKAQDVYAWRKDLYEQKLILVTSPPACGKTYVAKALAKQLHNIVYLDKDTLIVLSKQIFKVAGQPYDRSSAFLRRISAIMSTTAFWPLRWRHWIITTLCWSMRPSPRRCATTPLSQTSRLNWLKRVRLWP